MKTILFILFVVLYIPIYINAQSNIPSKIDSLFIKIKLSTSDTCTINCYNKLAREYLISNDLKNCELYANKSYEQSTKINYKLGIAISINYLGKIDKRNERYAQALYKYLQSLKIVEDIKDTVWISRNLNNIGELYMNQGIYDKGIKYCLKSLKFKERQKDKKGEGIGFNTIGSILFRASENEEAIKYFEKSLKIFEEIGFTEGVASIYSNLGLIYLNTAIGLDTLRLYKSLDNFEKSLIIQKKQKHKEKEVADLYNNIGNINAQMSDVYKLKINNSKDRNFKLNYQRKFKEIILKSIEYYSESLKARELIYDKAGVAFCYFNIGKAYSNIGEVFNDYSQIRNSLDYMQKALTLQTELNNSTEIALILNNIAQNYIYLKQYDNAKLYLIQSQKLSIEFNVINSLVLNYELFAKIYESTGNYKKALIFLRLASASRDSINIAVSNKNTSLEDLSTKSVKKIIAKYENDKIETQLKLFDTENKLQITQIKQQKFIIILCVIGFLIILIFTIIFFKQMREKKKANIILAQQKEEITSQRDEISSQRDLVTLQKEHIEEIHKEVTDSINYAERIQHSFMATKEILNENLNEYFVLFHPKDIVSGDFYWAYKLKNGTFLLVTADSTGHGVPGAIMSILNISSLEKAVDQELYNPSDILNYTRQTIIKRLKQDGSPDGGKDGMDASLICFDFVNQKFTYSAANNPIWVIRENILTELSPDKMPVGKHDNDQILFTQHEFQLQKGDVIYTLTDGMPDQFGGPKGKKFLSKNLKQLLKENCLKPMSEQKEILDKTIEGWKNGYEIKCEQTDDITIMGIKIS